MQDWNDMYYFVQVIEHGGFAELPCWRNAGAVYGDLHRGIRAAGGDQSASGTGERIQVRHQPRYFTTDMLALKSAALAGVGVVQLPVLMLTDELAKGTLVAVLPNWRPPREVIHIVFPSRRGMLPSVRALIDFISAEYAAIEED